MKRPSKIRADSGHLVKNLTGVRIGKLVVQELASCYGCTFWRCLCDCGRVRNLSHETLRLRKAKDCGHCTSPRITIPRHGAARA
jgi:hypothetical protein